MRARYAGLVGLVGAVAVTAVGPEAVGQPTAQKPVWVYAHDLRVRKGGEKDFTKDTPKVGVEFFKDEAGGALAPVLPGVVIPAARKVLREMVGHLIVDATDAKLGRSIAKIKKDGVRLNVNLLGEAILGGAEASRRLEGTRRLLARPDVDYVSIKVSSTVAPHNHWAFEEAVGHIVGKLAPLYRLAAATSPHKFINLDMEEYKDLDLTIAVFTRLLEREEFRDLEAGIVLQAYLPDALGAMIRLQEWAAVRTAAGGAPVKVRVVKGANLPMELVDADLHGWPAATWGSKQESDTSYKAVLDYALTPERTANVRIGVAGHNLFDLALAHLLAQARGVDRGTGAVEFEMLLGMATGQAAAVKADVGSLLLYTPVVNPEEFDVDPAGGRLFVSNEDTGELSIVDLETGAVVRTVAVGKEPEGVRLRPDRAAVYVTSESEHEVTVVDTTSGAVLSRIAVGWRPRDVVFSADGTRAYVSSEHGGSVAVVDVAAGAIVQTITLPAGSLPMGLALSPGDERLYVANGRARTVSVVDLAAGQVVADVRVGARPWGIGLTSDGKFLYTANGPSNDVSVIDTASLNVVATIRVGATPWGIAVGPAPREP